MKLNRLFAFLMTFLFVGIFVTGTVGLITTARLGEMLTNVVDRDLVHFLLATEVRRNIRSQLLLTKDYILASHKDERSTIVERLEKAKSDSLAKIAELGKIISDEEKSTFRALESSYEIVLRDQGLIIEHIDAGDSKAAELVSMRPKGDPTWDESIKSLIDHKDKVFRNQYTAARNFKETSIWFIGATLIGVMCLGLIVGKMVYGRISSNIASMLSLQNDLLLANQDLEKKVHERTKAINRILAKLIQTEKEVHVSKSIIKILQDRDAFARFIVDTRTSFVRANQKVHAGQIKKIRMLLHTMKGNALAFGLSSIAATIHEVEGQANVEVSDLSKIESEIQAFLTNNATILKLAYEDVSVDEDIVVHQDRLQTIAEAIEKAPTKMAAVESFKTWMAELNKRPVTTLLGPIQDLVKGLGERLGKNVSLKIVGDGLRVDPEISGPVIRNIVHILRNCIDHGIESPGYRGRKPERGLIKIEFYEDRSYWGVKISDDGRGIDVGRLKETAIRKGILPADQIQVMSDEEAFELIFLDGFSTAEVATDISGQGIGMGVVRRAAELAGGGFHLSRSEVGVGTSFVIQVPKQKRPLKKVA